VTAWYRVFGGRDVEVPPAELMAELRRLGVTAPVRFHGDEQGWFRAVVLSPAEKPLAEINRYLASEEGIRAELNTWAAWLEAAAPDRPELMEQVVLAPDRRPRFLRPGRFLTRIGVKAPSQLDRGPGNREHRATGQDSR
jgi:hypothetical protein